MLQIPLLAFFLALGYWQLAPWLQPRHPRRIRSAVWSEEDHWQLRCGDGAWIDARLVGQFYQIGPLTQLRFQGSDGRGYAITICAGMVDAQALRRLRVRLRLYALQDSSPQQPNSQA